jgi:hypothetical protein
MLAYRFIKIIFVVLLCALLALANYAPDQVVISGLWWIPGFVFSWGVPLPLMGAINLFGLLFSAALPIALLGYFNEDWNPHASTAALYLLNPVAILVWFAQEPVWLEVYLFIPRVLLIIYIVSHIIAGSRNREESEPRVILWRPILTIAYIVIFTGLLVAYWRTLASLSADHFKIDLLVWGRFLEIWWTYWNSTVLYIIIAALAVLFALRILVRFSKINVSTIVGGALGMGIVFLAIIVSLPALQGHFVSPDKHIDDVAGLTGLVQRLSVLPGEAGHNILLVQNDLRYDNIFLQPARDILPLIEHLLPSRIISATHPISKLAYIELNNQAIEGTLSLASLSGYGVEYVAVIEPRDQEAFSTNLDNIFALARSDNRLTELQLTTDVARRAFLFQNLNYNNEKVEKPDEQALKWRYNLVNGDLVKQAQAEVQTKVSLPASAEFILNKQGTDWQLQLGPSAGNTTINGQVVKLGSAASNVLTFPSTRKAFYLIANEQPLGEISPTTTLPFDESLLRTVRLYGRYDNTNILELADFAGITNCGGAIPSFSLSSTHLSVRATNDTCLVLASPNLESRSSLLLELALQATTANATLSACIYDVREGRCILDVNKVAAKEFDPLWNKSLQIRVYLKRSGLGSEISANISQLRLREYELTKFITTSVLAPKASLIDVQRGDRIVITQRPQSIIEVDLGKFSQCDLDLTQQLKQSLTLIDAGLEIKTSDAWCVSAELGTAIKNPATAKVFANGMYEPHAKVIGTKVYLNSKNDAIISSVRVIVP